MRIRASSGFSLLELMVVLLLMGLVYGLASPYVSNVSTSLDAKAACRQVAAALRKARSEAVTSGHEVLFSLNVDARTFRISGDPKNYQLPGRIDLKLLSAKKDLLDESTASIRFMPEGSSTGGQVTILSEKLEQVVEVDWLTGAVTVK